MLIERYNRNWVTQFKALKEELSRSLTSFITIEHVGSTSIPGMFAKPIIDIDIEISSMDNFQILNHELEKIGYKHVGDMGIAGREAFKRKANQDSVLDKIEHHLYVCPSDSKEYRRHILFRDYLRNNMDTVEEYNRIKLDILKKYGENNREKYVEIKDKKYRYFFEDIIRKAEESFNNA